MTPIKLSELERLAKECDYDGIRHAMAEAAACSYTNDNGAAFTGFIDGYHNGLKDTEDLYANLSRLCEALRIAHGALENISSRNIHLKVKLSDLTEELYIDRDSRVLEAANAKYKINSLVDLS